jgi:hypothetical protein
VHNRVVHEIDNVLSPTENTVIESIAENKKFSLIHKALIVTSLEKEL